MEIPQNSSKNWDNLPEGSISVLDAVQTDEKNQSSDLPCEIDTQLSHKEALSKFQTMLSEVIANDSLISDLHTHVTLEEVNSQVALEYGRAMTVNVHRSDGTVMPIVVEQKATVLDLKKAICRYVTLKQLRENGTRRISWRYIWKTYWLYFGGQKLTEDHKLLKDYGIRNKEEVTFIKRLREK